MAYENDLREQAHMLAKGQGVAGVVFEANKVNGLLCNVSQLNYKRRFTYVSWASSKQSLGVLDRLNAAN